MPDATLAATALAGAPPAPAAPAPLLIRIVHGDIVDVHASLIAVTHVNDVAPTGAEAALDWMLGGALSRRASALNGLLGTTHFVPALTSPLAAACVLVVSLGDVETFTHERLREVGAAIVEAAATIGVRDVATVVHGAGPGGIDPTAAATLLLSGVLDALTRVPGAETLRELAVVERDEDRLDLVHAGVLAAASSPRVHVYVERARSIRTAPQPADTVERDVVADHLRLGITRAASDLKITVIGHGAFDQAELFPFPSEVAARLVDNLHQEVLAEEDPLRRARALRSIGQQLANAFLHGASLDVPELVHGAPDGLLVLRVDDWTVDLPWELARVNGEPLALSTRLSRQLELLAVGRQAALVPTHDRLQVLMVGDPTGDLPGAAAEATAVATTLKALPSVDVTVLEGGVTYGDVSRELDGTAYDVLHYAGHARFDVRREDNSGLVLADGVLTAQDLASRAYLPRLVIANACHSAATGDARLQQQADAGRVTRNLVTGILGAGARAFIGAMWQVADDAATTFATGLYETLLRDGAHGKCPIGDAVREGRRRVIEAHGEGEPAWAAYTLYGSPWRPAW